MKINNNNIDLQMQEIQNEFNQKSFELGQLEYRRKVLKDSLSDLANEANTIMQAMEKLSRKAQKLSPPINPALAEALAQQAAQETTESTTEDSTDNASTKEA